MELANYDEEVLKDPNTVFVLSDADAHMFHLCSSCYSTHLHGYRVRERGSFTLEAAVHTLTAPPAQVPPNGSTIYLAVAPPDRQGIGHRCGHHQRVPR